MLKKTYVARAEIIIMVPDTLTGEPRGEKEITEFCGKTILEMETRANAPGNPRLHLSDCREASKEV